MNGGQVFATLLCFAGVIFVLLGFEITVFRIACLACRVPQPGFFRSIGMVMVLLVVPAVVDGIVGSVLFELYKASNYPLWEAGLVQFFLALPIHMAICSTIHAKMMSLRLGQGIEVWFVEKVMKFTLLLLIVGAVALVFFLKQAKG